MLQEAKIMGFGVYGSDIEQRMVDYTTKNLQWIEDKLGSSHSNDNQVAVVDAATGHWPKQLMSGNLSVASEAYLGLPFAHLPSEAQLEESIQQSNTIIKAFLKNIHQQSGPGLRMCVGVPAWHIKNKIIHLPCLRQLSDLGWKRRQFTLARDSDLIYRRDDQIVGRELVILEKL